MYSFTDLQREIGAKIESLVEQHGSELHPDWITHAILSDHPDVQGVDADFYTCCSRVSIRKEVREQINKIDSPDSKTNKQLSLDGFEHLQQFYVVRRDNEQVAVRIDNLTDTEIDLKAREYDSMGRTLLQHSDELLRYKELRRAETRAIPLTLSLHPENRPAA
jgi:hypothetical protein